MGNFKEGVRAAPAEASAWVITDGTAGTERQGAAVAEAAGLPFIVKRTSVRGMANLIPTRLKIHLPPAWLLAATMCEEGIAPPWPRLLISSGSRSVPVALAIKRLAGGAVFALHVQDPKVPPNLFDLVAAPKHDGLTGANVIETFGSLHSVTPARMRDAMRRFAPAIEALGAPRIAVLLGGTSKAFRFPPEEAQKLGRALAALAAKHNASLLVTPSRRTGAEALRAFLAETGSVPHLVWDGTGDNPYFAYLGFADWIVVTGDSVNMITEAAGTGKPVYVYHLPGHSRRLARFHTLMQEAGATRPFDGRLESWSYAPINDTECVARAVRGALGLEGQNA